MSERIIAAAVRWNWQTYSLLPPARHTEVLRLVEVIHGDIVIEPQDQGFVTDQNRFVTRSHAKIIARAAGQLLEGHSQS